jgi:hypothetical protein
MARLSDLGIQRVSKMTIDACKVLMIFPRFNTGFVLELLGNLRTDTGALPGGAAWPDYRRRAAPVIPGGAAR